MELLNEIVKIIELAIRKKLIESTKGKNKIVVL